MNPTEEQTKEYEELEKKVRDAIEDGWVTNPADTDCPSRFSAVKATDNVLSIIAERKPKNFPKIVCLCGSTRFGDAFQRAQISETLTGKIVLTIGCNMKTDTELFRHLSSYAFEKIKTKLDELHLRKIDLADEVLILNVGGYIGDSTRNELDYAESKGKVIRFLEEIKKEE